MGLLLILRTGIMNGQTMDHEERIAHWSRALECLCSSFTFSVSLHSTFNGWDHALATGRRQDISLFNAQSIYQFVNDGLSL
jgi:hypothetical protein